MTPAKTLRVRAVGDALVPVYEALRSRRFVGRKFDESSGSWIADGEAEVPDTIEYQRALSEGHLELVVDDNKKKAAKAEVK